MTVATESLEEGDGVDFSPNHQGCGEVLFSLFAPTNAVSTGEFPQMPTNKFFELYFVPGKARREGTANQAIHRMSAPPCQSKSVGFLG